MIKVNNILGGFIGGAIGGMAVDLIYISLAGPSGLFTLIGITERCAVFGSHVVLGGFLGILFSLILKKLPNFNIWLAGILWGLACLLFIGGIPSFIAKLPISSITIFFGLLVWILYGLILAAIRKLLDKKNFKKG